MQDIRQPELQTRQFRLDRLEQLLDALQCRAERIAHGQQGCGILPCRLGPAHGLGIGVALRAQAVGFDLQGLAPLLESCKSRDVELKAAARQLGGDTLQIAAQQLRIEHVGIP